MHSFWHYLRHTDLYLLFIALCCSGYGAVLVYSSTLSYGTNRYMIVQLSAVAIGIFAFVFTSLADLETIGRYWKWFLLLNIILQLTLLVFGSEKGGNTSWINLGFITIQPAEIGKVIFVFTFAAHLARESDQLNHWQTLLTLGLHAMLMIGIVIATSDDVGMALSYVAIAAIMLFGAGVSLKWFAGAFVLSIASIPMLYQLLKGYRLTRILVLFDPTISPKVYWQTGQSKIAIGAGKLFGEGFLKGNQTQFSKLPVKHSDMIFSVAAEEFGMIGALVVVGLLSLLILRLFYVSYTGATTFSSLLAVGIAGMFLFQTFENIFMCLGFFPIVGLTLPLFSYGGTSVITMYASLGLAAGVRMREKPSWLRR